ncbi:M28 family peptidase [Flavivirga rizhaonensis]|uniref:M28 family peptidase n=1 Tax=Flavivirga rizhaonensis TaxID=2559571 RepID=A0A4S1DWV8_9FLAO|nr:M28 family peptidase [Flavivirga rizhaonensis]TGV01982.1 M28 family peptidase [Flavivirga rizhaonensis]
MKIKLIALCFLCHFICINVNSQICEKEASFFCEESMLKHLKSLSSDAFEGRRTGTRGALKTRKYIINQFHSLNVQPLGKGYEQPFLFVKKQKEYKAVNILGLIEGTKNPDEYIVISAHYDHEGIKKGAIYNGADDNASGLSALFSFGEYFKNNPPKYSVILAAFDGEELGLQGSKYFVKNPIIPLKNIKVNINMDMIGRSEKNELYVVGTERNKKLKHAVSYYQHSKKIKLIEGHNDSDALENWTYSSDHVNFYKKGIPFLYFGVEDHNDYHEPTDDYENIHPEFYVEAVKVIVSVFEKIDNLRL